MAVWDDLVDYMTDGIFGGTGSAVVMIVFILGLSAYGLWKSRKIFKEV